IPNVYGSPIMTVPVSSLGGAPLTALSVSNALQFPSAATMLSASASNHLNSLANAQQYSISPLTNATSTISLPSPSNVRVQTISNNHGQSANIPSSQSSPYIFLSNLNDEVCGKAPPLFFYNSPMYHDVLRL
ncbi:unnamed protein product, partial [Didymodactylos carnosus]